MKKTYKALVLSMAAVVALTTTSSAMAMHVPGLSQIHSLNAKLNRKKRKLDKTTIQAVRGFNEHRNQNYVDRKGNKEDKTQVQIAVLEQEKAALIRQYPHLKAYENGSSPATEVVLQKSTGNEKHSHGHDHGTSEGAYQILADGTEIPAGAQVYILGGDESVAGQGQGDDVTGLGQGKPGFVTAGTKPNEGGTNLDNIPPENEKKKTEGGDRQDEVKDKEGEEKSAPAKQPAPAKKPAPLQQTAPVSKPLPPKSVKKPTSGGDRQDQIDKKAKQRAEQDRINKEKADEAARLKRESERLAQIEEARKRQEQIDLKNKEKALPKPTVCFPDGPVVGEQKCFPVEEDKTEQTEVSSGIVNGRIKGKDKVEAKTETVLYGQSGIKKSEKRKKKKLKINARFKGATVDEAALLAKTIDGIFEKREESHSKVGNHTGLKNTGAELQTDSSTNRPAITSHSNRAQ